MSEYDTQEAVAILARTNEAIEPTSSATIEASALEMIKIFARVVRERGLFTNGHHRDPVVEILKGAKHVWVSWADGEVRVSADGGKTGTRVAVEYEPVSGTFVGSEPDTYITPVPGEPMRRRSALAVLAEAVSNVLIGS